MSRMEKVNQQIKREVSRIIQRELSDPRLEFVSILRVDVSKDLRNARVYYSVLGDEKQKQDAQNGLDGARGMVRRLVGKNITMRNVPDFIFTYDNSLEISVQLDKTIQEIHNESEEDSSTHQEE